METEREYSQEAENRLGVKSQKKQQELIENFNKNGLNLFQIKNLSYKERARNLTIQSSGEVKSTKFFPVFLDKDGKEEIFKPLSKTKPLSTPLFAYSEVFRSHIIKEYFDPNAPLYQLATCEGIGEEQPKYHEKGTLVPSLLKEKQKLINLLEYFREHPDSNVNIENYINYCMQTYDYEPILNANFFKKKKELGEQLSNQILLSILMRNQNFHYENIAFIEENGEIVSLAPPIDHEFSSMFLYPEHQQMHKKTQKEYEIFNLFSEGHIHKNISLIVERYPEFTTKFLKNLNQFQKELEKREINIENSPFIGEFSSIDYKIGEARIKKGNATEAEFREKKIQKIGIDTQQFSQQLKSECLKSCEILKRILLYYLEKNGK